MKPQSSTGYIPGRSIAEIADEYNLPIESIIKLGSNENPLGPSPAAVRAIIEHAKEASIYPDSDALSGYAGYPAGNIVAGAGMDGVIDTLMRMPGEAIRLLRVARFKGRFCLLLQSSAKFAVHSGLSGGFESRSSLHASSVSRSSIGCLNS